MLLTSNYQLFVGIDIAAVTFTVTWIKGDSPNVRPLTLEQTPKGFATLQQHLQATTITPDATLIVLEATGSYWITLATTLHYAGYQVRVINPAQAHHFAKALLKRAKTDAIELPRCPSSQPTCSRLLGPHLQPYTTNFSSDSPNGIHCSRCVNMYGTNCMR